MVDTETVDLTDPLQASLDYDIALKTLTVDLLADFANGDSFVFAPASGNEPRDVDGDPFTESAAGTVAGETDPPSVVRVVQNQNIDPTGLTLEVEFSEDVGAGADDPGGYVVRDGALAALAVDSVTHLASPHLVRVVLDGTLAIPGEATVDVSGVQDLAGNAMDPQTGIAVESTDVTAPVASAAAVIAEEGPDNDRLQLTFSEDMLAAEVEDPLNWTVESPPGTPRSTAAATASYDSPSRTGTLTFDGGDGIHFQAFDGFSVALAGMRDLGGNAIDPTPLEGTVDAERDFPELVAVAVDPVTADQVQLRFSEPMQFLDDLHDPDLNPQGTRYELLGADLLPKAQLLSATPDGDDMGVLLVFSAGAEAGANFLRVYGPADLAGNQMTPVDQADIVARELDGPAVSAVSATSVSGEDNDVVRIDFDRALSPWQLEDPSHFSLDKGGTSLSLAQAEVRQVDADTVDILLNWPGSDFLENALLLEVQVSGISSAQGVPLTGASAGSDFPEGDAETPSVAALGCVLDPQDELGRTVLLELIEAMNPLELEDEENFKFGGAGGTDAQSATLAGPRTLRAVHSGSVGVGTTVQAENYRDLAGNSLGVASVAVQAAVTTAPVLLDAAGRITPGLGGDRVEVRFAGPLDPVSAVAVENYTVAQGSTTLDTQLALARYQSSTAGGSSTVTLHLPEGVELDPALGLTVTVTEVANLSGLPLTSPAVVNSTDVTGDDQPPGLEAAFVNYRADASGHTVDLVFDEDVMGTGLGDPLSYGSSGAQIVLSATQIHPDRVRVVLDAPLASGEELTLSGATDVAGNATAGALAIAPQM